MKDKRIFPISVLEQSADGVLVEGSGPAGILYLSVLLAVMAVFILSFHVTVSVNVSAPGIIRPRQDHVAVTAGYSGYASGYGLYVNRHVEAGDTLLTVRSDLILVQWQSLQDRRTELQNMIWDLHELSNVQSGHVRLKSPVYKKELSYYMSQTYETESRRNIAGKAYERSRSLFEAGIIPLSEFEAVEGQYMDAVNAVSSFQSGQKRRWQSDLEGYMAELRNVETRIGEMDIQSAQTVVLSPVSGTIVQLQPLAEGAYITAGQCLMEISPDGDLIAECYVSPKDIGYFHEDMEGRLQVSSYKYTEWGMLDVSVSEVSDDVTVSADGTESFYRVYCRLAQDHLCLRNGTIGPVRKGMTVNGNFIITRRTAFQLLYDRIDDWINPNTVRNE